MTVSASTQIPKTSDPAIFQRQCKVLFECLLGDPGVQEFGTSGQAQHGIDLLGRRKSIALDHWIGIQCKLKIKAEKLSKKIVREEADKALSLEPALKELIIVTTAPDDAALHKEAAAFTDEQAKAGRDFHVQVWGWGTLETYILQYDRAISAFSPDAFPHLQRLLHGQDNLSEQTATGHAEIMGALGQLLSHQMSMAQSRSLMSEVDGSSHGTLLDKQIDQYRDLITEGNSPVALKMLQALWDELPGDAAGHIHFRIRTNIAACRLRLGEQEEAARLYLEAYEYAPEEPKAAAFRVLGLVLLDRPQEAYDFGFSMLGTVVDKSALVVHMLMAARLLPELDDVFDVIPKEVQNDAFVAIAKIDYLRTRGKPEEWHELAIEAHAEHPGDKNLSRLAAEAAIDRGCQWSDENGRAILPAELEIEVRAAIETLSSQFDEALSKPSSAEAFDDSLCSNLATAYRLLRDLDKARATVHKGMAISPNDEGLLQNLAMIALEDGTPDEAASLLDMLPNSRDKVFGQLQVLANHGRWRNILALSNQTDISAYSDADQAFFESIVFLARFRLGESADPRADADALLVKFNAEPIVPIVLYDIATSQRDTEWSAMLYLEARDKQEHLSLPERLMLARVAEHEEDPEAVIDLLYGEIPLCRDSDELRLLARSFVNAPPRQDAVAFAKQLPEELKREAFYARAVGGIDFNRGALLDAEAAYRDAIAADPTDVAAHLGLLNTFLRMDKKAEVEIHLRCLDLAFLQGPAAQKVGLAQLLVQFGRAEEGLAYGYDVAQQNRNNGRACLLYVGLILPEPTNLRIPEIGDTISVDCTVEIERSDGSRRKVTIEAGPDRADIECYNPAHPFAGILIGTKTGDTVIYEAGGGTPQRWQVLGFKHKYLALLHDIMETFPTRFPDIGGFYVFELPQGDVEPILEQVKAQSETDAKLFNLHIAENYPLCVVAGLMGRSTMEVASQLSLRNAVVKTCVGTHVEREAAIALIADAREKGIVLDAYTAWCVYSTNHIATLKTLFPRMVLPQSALDELRIWRQKYEHRSDEPLMTIGYIDGQYFRQEHPPEELRKSAETIDKAIEVLSCECEILPAAAPSSPSRLERVIIDVARSASLDPVYLAMSEGLLLLSEDLHYRNLARQLYQRAGVWLQTVLMVALAERVIDGATYAQSVVDLAARKHDYVTVDVQNLMTIAEQDEDDAMPRLAAALTFIGNGSADVASHSQVGWDFLLQIWRLGGISTLRKERACGMMLERLTSMWSRQGDVVIFLKKMITQTDDRPQLQSYIRNWACGHFIVLDQPATTNQQPKKRRKKKKTPRRHSASKH